MAIKAEQLTLLPETPPNPSIEVDTEAIARAGELRNQGPAPYDPNKPLSDAALDQGWRPPETPPTPAPSPVRTGHVFELPGKDGRRNPADQLPVRGSAHTPESDAIYAKGAAKARAALDRIRAERPQRVPYGVSPAQLALREIFADERRRGIPHEDPSKRLAPPPQR